MLKKTMCIFLMFVFCITMFIPSLAKTQENEEQYRIVFPAVEDTGLFDTSDIQQGIVRAGWGCSLYVALVKDDSSGDQVSTRSNDRSILPNNNDEYVVDARWEAILPDGTKAQPIEVKENGYVLFAVPFEMTGEMTIQASIDGVVVDRFELIVVGTDKKGNPIKDWRFSFKKWYYIMEGGMLKRGWLQYKGSWYYLDSQGIMQTGWQKIDGVWYYMNQSGAMMTGWIKDGSKWYYMNSSGAMETGWKIIDNTWYFFKSNGAMAASEWCGGYWLNANGSWTYKPVGSWKKNAQGWWFGDTSGWYARSTSAMIDNVLYKFNASGYLVLAIDGGINP